jgi:hypothetical protein
MRGSLGDVLTSQQGDAASAMGIGHASRLTSTPLMTRHWILENISVLLFAATALAYESGMWEEDDQDCPPVRRPAGF